MTGSDLQGKPSQLIEWYEVRKEVVKNSGHFGGNTDYTVDP